MYKNILFSATITTGKDLHWDRNLQDKNETGQRIYSAPRKPLFHRNMVAISSHHKVEFDLVLSVTLLTTLKTCTNLRRRLMMRLRLKQPRKQ